jgi:hypothetical protein
MRTFPLTLATGLAAIAAASGAAPAAAGPITGPILGPSSADGVLVYSQLDPDGQWSLHQRDRSGALRRLAVPRSEFDPFDVDMGRTADGELVALYSRCDTVCRIYELAVDTGQERLVPGVHARGHSETMPTLHHGVLGFQRERVEDGARRNYRLIALRDGARSRRVKALRAQQAVTGADLSARGLALSTSRLEPLSQGGGEEVSVQVKPSNRPFRTLFDSRSGEQAVTVTPPSWRGDDVYWGFTRYYDPPAGDRTSRTLLRGRVTAGGTDRDQIIVPDPPGEEGTVITGAAADDVDRGAPLWIATTNFVGDEEVEFRTALDAYPIDSLTFGR